MRAESSLFYTRYGSYETKADGMILICDDDKRDTIAQNIIRQTMWNRKSLLNDHYTERDKPVRFSRSPIKLRTQYKRVYLTTTAQLEQRLKTIYRDEFIITHTIKQGVRLRDPKQGDIEDWPTRYLLNPAFDLLKLVYFFSAVKTSNELALKSSFGAPSVDYAIIMQRRDLPILRMYPDVVDSERVEVYEFGFGENTETH